ncbi:hypothetical protein [Lignipirellula cremea]|uniref:Uncharacterized protein n=1 Tax=Lignipirellula cremea TaxID=2528010 RepID=A0A518E124_9BACT|nr:hypothetical protein [Lignipirellula cremea]QDU97790.1 hypothetical protein Pla8534_56460 [Lignipirellula cremea]
MTKQAFDPTETRNLLLSDIGCQWQLQRSFEESKNCGGLSSSAHADLGAAVECILVGLGDFAYQLLVKARNWATESITSENETADWMTFQTLAMSDWLLENRHNLDTYQKFMVHLDRLLENPTIANDAVNVSLMLPAFVDGSAFERVLQIFERTAKHVEPGSLDRISNEAQLCLVIARHHLGVGYTTAEVDAACDKFMFKNMAKWLRDGHFVRAAEWMKIIWGNFGKAILPPNETVLKCYDYLHDCHRPF